MTALLLITLLSAAPPEVVAVAVTSDRAGAQEAALAVAGKVHETLVREGAPQALSVDASAQKILATGFGDPKSCKGARGCLQQLAVLLGTRALLVSVDVGKLGRRLAIHLEVLTETEVLEATDLAAEADRLDETLAVGVTVFARKVAARIEERRPKQVDAPVAVSLTPAAVTPGPDLAAAPEARSIALPAVATGVAVVATGLAVTFAILGAGARAEYEKAKFSTPGGPGTTLTAAEAQALAGRANTNFSVALGAGIGAGLTGALAGILWATR